MSLVYIGLGSNLGNRKRYLKQAIKALDEKVGPLVKCSSFYETLPMGFSSPHLFLNSVAVFETKLSPENVLNKTEEIERSLGRLKKSINRQYEDRCVDIDILFYDDLVIQTEKLTIPHPRLHERPFVLEPLKEIASDLIHPVLKKKIEQL